jgi:flavodoxin
MDINIIYASTSGNVEIVCQHIAKCFSKHNIQSQLHRAELTDIKIIEQNNLFIFATSTWEHGEINPYFNKLLHEMQSINMESKKAGFVGLGDFRYEPILFNVGIDHVKKTFCDNGGEQIGRILKLNGEPYHLLDTVVSKWFEEILQKINE